MTARRHDNDDSSLAPSTVRAYTGDVRATLEWCVDRGITPELRELDAGRVFAHCVELVQLGRRPSTIRRRLTALRATAAVTLLRASPSELFDLERRLARAFEGQTSVLVISDDPIARSGSESILDAAGALCWSSTVDDLDPPTLTSWDYILVWLAPRAGPDRLGAISRFEGVSATITAAVPIIAVYSGQLQPIARLRLSEAGFRYAIPHEWLSGRLSRLSELVRAAELPQEFYLETPLSLRQTLGLRLSGSLAPLLEAASAFPPDVWTSSAPQAALPITRHQVRRLRSIAADEAGVPAPDFRRYATSTRRPPDVPEWEVVRNAVQAAFGLSATP